MVPGPPTEEGSVTVVVRLRPQTPREQEGNRQSVVQVVGNCMLVFDPEEPSLPGVLGGVQSNDLTSRRKGKNLPFAFDRVFRENATQAEVFENTTKEILDGVLNGYNCSVFAYGATGAGKTYTMLGSEKEPGIMYFTMEELYRQIEARREEKHCEVLISYQEVYNEQIHDLLEPKGPLAIREDPEKGVVVQGLSYHQPTSAGQLLEMLRRGNLNRTQHPTDINATSSRSHAVFQIHVMQQDRMVGVTRDLRVAKMSLIDLAGSERASATKAKGERLREGANINRSLLALINVINGLADAKIKKPHIPYRDSKLTRLLKDSIGGNCRTIMIAAISPSVLSYEDTYNTLKYASRAKEIKLLLKSNVVSLDCHINQYAAVCEQLKAEVADLRGRLRVYEENVPEVSSRLIPAVLAPSGPGQDELLRSKEAGLDCEALNKGNGETELLKLNNDASCSGKSSTEQELRGNFGCSSAESSIPAKQHEKLNARLQGMDKKQLVRLIMAILHVARRQYALLKSASLLTPDTRVEFEELDGLVQGEPWGPPESSTGKEQTRELDAATQGSLDVEEQQLTDNAFPPASLPATECADPAGSPRVPPATPEREPIPSTVFKTPHLPTKKRRKLSGSASLSEKNAPSSQKGRAKRRRKACLSPQQVGPLEEWAAFPRADCTSTPVADKAKSPSPSHRHTLQYCPLTVTKSRVPLATSAAKNGSTPAPPRGLNTTFDLCEDPCPPNLKLSAPEFPAWESVQHLSNHQGAPFIPRASMAVFTMKGSSIPRSSSSASRASAPKRRRATNPASHSLGAPRSRIARLQGTSVKRSQITNAPGQPSSSLAWKWR
ncbi:kinesin-like protein KIF18B isoform X2 [Rhineura floridana]|nr:kinesin-like protein KIF18B isoform X2 [Rhineura floridana]XP_061445902.1 kinesin-like protein KIF18B isoform X2 [Rhineura floridana]